MLLLLLLLGYVVKLTHRVSELENQKVTTQPELKPSYQELPEATPISPPPVVSVPEPLPTTSSTTQKLETQQPTIPALAAQTSLATPSNGVSQWHISYLALIVWSLILSLLFLFVVDGHFSESLRDNPALAVGHFVVSLFLIPIGAAVGVPCWLLVRFSKRPERVSFRPFILVGMAVIIALLWLGRAYAESHS